jgi:hypothetical protein
MRVVKDLRGNREKHVQRFTDKAVPLKVKLGTKVVVDVGDRSLVVKTE